MNPVKRTVYLMLCGVAALTLALVVLVRNHDLGETLLAALGIVGAIAIIIVSLPSNGDK